MRFYKAKYTNNQYEKGEPLSIMAWQLRDIVARNKQGDSVVYSGQFSSTENLLRGAVIIGEINGIISPYKIMGTSSGSTGVNVYMISEDGVGL